jgi:hypothetical protein
MKSLFVIGDSISIQYGPYLKKLVEGRFHYDRKRGEAEALADLDRPVGANGGDSSMVLEYLLGEQSRGVRYDILLINCGLHDIKTDPAAGGKQVPLDQYRDNLEQIAAVARQMAQAVIWVRTTDAVESIHNARSASFHRYHADVLAYNEAADETMGKHRIPTLDLYAFTRVFGESAYRDHVHYTDEVCRLQAAYIAGYLERFVQETG